MPKRKAAAAKAAPQTKKAKTTAKGKATAKTAKGKKGKAKTTKTVAAPKPAPKPAPAPATPIQRSKGKEMSDDIKKLFHTLAGRVTAGEKVTVYDLDDCSANDLKAVLKLNDRSTTGNRTDLMKAVAECIRQGCPPRCPKCGGGRLRYANKRYWCPGYMEDDEFVNCAFAAKDGEVVNNPWKSPPLS